MEYQEFDKKNIMVHEILQRAKKGVQLYDFAHAVKEGQLRPIKASIPERPAIARKEKPTLSTPTVEKVVSDTRTEVVNVSHSLSVSDIDELLSEEQKESTQTAEPEAESYPMSELMNYFTKQQKENPKPEVPEMSSFAERQKGLEIPPMTSNVIHPKENDIPYWKTVPFIVEVIMLLVAGGSAVMSAYHTVLFMSGVLGRPEWVSLFIGIILILFSASSFTASRHFFMEKGVSSKVFGSAFVFLGILVVVFSMFSTMGVSHQQFAWQEKDAAMAVIEARTEAATAQQTREFMELEVRRLDNEIARTQEEIRTHTTDSRSHTTDEHTYQAQELWGLRNIARQNRITSQRELSQAQERLSVFNNQRNEAWESLVSSSTTGIVASSIISAERGDIFTITASVLNTEEETLMFFIYTLPAVFFDLVAPFGVTIILLLEDRRRRRKLNESC